MKRFQDFLYRNFREYEHCRIIYLHNNQTTKLYETEETHEIKKEKLKFRPILDQTGTHTYNMAQVISTYLKPSFRNEYAIDDTEIFPKHIKDLPPLQEDDEDVSFDMKSLFTIIPINETIEHSLDQIYNIWLYNGWTIICHF